MLNLLKGGGKSKDERRKGRIERSRGQRERRGKEMKS